MKRRGRLFGLLALALTMLSLQAVAETQLRGRDFDHKGTGFTLSGGHASAVCGRCHVDGIYKGTPKNCNGCHALGKYLLKPTALTTPNPTSDIVTNEAVEKPQPESPDKNHATTGFPLLGGHATAACATCHVDGIFKGTPKKCDDCHAVGKRIVATPKSTSHVITDAPCESCHFNTSTWLGARFNHGTAQPGQCATCHNGRIAAGKHAAHVATTSSCDQCHRSSSWIPASWNHTGSTYSGQDCSTCHNASGPGHNYTTTIRHSIYNSLSISACKSCHTNYYSFYSHNYVHDKPLGSCAECHANTTYKDGISQAASPIHSVAANIGIANCSSCHKSFGAWVGTYDHAGATQQCSTCHSGTYASSGIAGKSANHVAYFATATECSACHTTTTSWSSIRGEALHAYLVSPSAPHTPTCRSCHSREAHDGKDGAVATMDCSTGGCHRPAGGQGTLYLDWEH